MSFFIPSTRTVSGAVAEIADSAGASADSDMTSRALIALNQSIKWFNRKVKWDFLLDDAAPTVLVAPFGVTGVTASAGQASALIASGHSLKPDDFLTNGAGILLGTRVSTTASASFTINTTWTANVITGGFSLTANRDFYSLPSDTRSIYSLRLLGAMRPLRNVRQRMIDRSVPNEYQVGTPIYYDTFRSDNSGRVRLYPAPQTTDVMQTRYYRRMATYTTSATATILDIPLDYDDYFIARAKWAFLMDKTEGRSDQAEKWMAFSQEGYLTMLADQNTLPDEDLMMSPGHFAYIQGMGPNSTWNVLQDDTRW